jgi:hypothetical protein
MTSDIKLDGEWVVVDGSWTKLRTHDLMLDSPYRRQNQSGARRALVHDTSDGLTINYAGDYPGGVTIKGKVSAESVQIMNATTAELKTDSLKVGSAKLAYTSTSGLHIGDGTSRTYIDGKDIRVSKDLIVDGDTSFGGEVKAHDIRISPIVTPANEGDPLYAPYSLFERIKQLQTKIEELEGRLRRLEHR